MAKMGDSGMVGVILEPGSADLADLAAAVNAAVSQNRTLRVAMDEQYLKVKVGEGAWSYGYVSHRPNGGY